MLYTLPESTMFKKILATLMLLGLIGTIAGCNTMKGLGQDVERGGEKIQDKAAR
jgi:predicted small secreted protein